MQTYYIGVIMLTPMPDPKKPGFVVVTPEGKVVYNAQVYRLMGVSSTYATIRAETDEQAMAKLVLMSKNPEFIRLHGEIPRHQLTVYKA